MKERSEYIDVLRGIGMLLVVYGHVTRIWYPDRVWIWSFHMPLFFFISGLLFFPEKYDSFKTFLRKKAIGRLIPYIVLYLLCLVYWYVVERGIFHRGVDITFLDQFVRMFWGCMTAAGGSLWFLPCLFVVEVTYYGVYRLFAKKWLQIVACFVLAGLGVALHLMKILYLPFEINSALLVMPFYGIAYTCREYIKRVFEKGNVVYLVVIVVCVAIQFLLFPYSDLDLSMRHLKSPLTYIPMALAGIMVCYAIAVYINKNRILEWIGKNSIVILAFHGFVYHGVIYLLAMAIGLDMEFLRHSYIWCIIITIITIMIVAPLAVLYKRYVERLWKVL